LLGRRSIHEKLWHDALATTKGVVGACLPRSNPSELRSPIGAILVMILVRDGRVQRACRIVDVGTDPAEALPAELGRPPHAVQR
jgi:hypothetical protein